MRPCLKGKKKRDEKQMNKNCISFDIRFVWPSETYQNDDESVELAYSTDNDENVAEIHPKHSIMLPD